MAEPVYRRVRNDPHRIASQLIQDLRWGKLTHLDRATIARVCDVELADEGKVSEAHRQRLIAATAERCYELWRNRTLARA